MGKIAITRITAVDADNQKTSFDGRVVIEESELEEYRKDIISKGSDINRVLLNYEEVDDD